MMEHYSHVRMVAKRDVLQKLESGLMEIPTSRNSTSPTQGCSWRLRHSLRHKIDLSGFVGLANY